MNLTRIAQAITYGLTAVLIVRLLALRLHSVYRVFTLFLLFDLSINTIYLVQVALPSGRLDYRLIYLITRLPAWIVALWMVYALLQAILANFRGILSLSRKVLNYAIPIAVGLALVSSTIEYSVLGSMNQGSSSLDSVVSIAIIIERVISTIALLVLLLMLVFILWFPVEMPQNLAVFSIGFILYFAAKTSFLLLRSLGVGDSSSVANNLVSFSFGACLCCWILFLNKQGEAILVTIGHSWQASKQNALMSELESLNAMLLRTARR